MDQQEGADPSGSRVTGATVTIVLVVSVFGVSFGVLGAAAGVPLWLAVASSSFVFAGSAQFAWVAVLAGGGPAAAAAISGILLNTRYLATGAAVAAVLPGGWIRRLLLAQLVVDESYALAVTAGTPRHPDQNVLLRSGVALWIGWVSGTVLGAALGPVLGRPEPLGLDAAFPSLFVALLVPMVRDRRSAVRTAAMAAAVAGALAPFAPPGVPLVAAAAVGLSLAPRSG